MSRTRTFDEDQVLEGAVDLFHERGYAGVSIPDIVDRLGICRQSLYSSFGDKRGLYLRALERWGEREVDAKVALLAGNGSPLENVRTLIRGFAAMAVDCPSEGCLTVTAMVENRDDPEALAAVGTQVTRMEDAFSDALSRARDLGELSPHVSPTRLGRSLITSCYGMGLLTRLPGSNGRIADAVAVMLDLLDASAA